MASGLKVAQLKLLFPTFSLQAHFTVDQGERLGLRGRSGIGKTTLFRTLTGLRPLNDGETGEVFVGKENITHRPPHKRRIGYLFQEPALLDHMNVLENVGLGLRLKGLPRQQREEESRSWLEKLHLSDKAKANISTLSGGEKQRVAFAQTLIAKPNLLLLDEPFSSMDKELRIELRTLLLQLVASAGVPSILVSHHADDLEFFATKIITFEERDGGATRVVEEAQKR